MKLHILLCTLFVSVALALPVPDEEVSPLKPATIGEIKPEAAEADAAAPKTLSSTDAPLKQEQPAIIPDSKPQEQPQEVKEAEKPLIKELPKEEKPSSPIIPLGTPDSELAQALPEQKKEVEKELEKEKEKNIRSENQAAEEPKKLQAAAGLAETPVPAAPSAIEKQEQVAEEEKPTVKEILPEGKVADLSATPALSATETKEIKPIQAETKIPEAPLSADIAAEPEATEAKKEDVSGRQERGEQANQIQNAVVADSAAAAAAPAAAAPAQSNAESSDESANRVKNLAESLPEPQKEEQKLETPKAAVEQIGSDLKQSEKKIEDLKSSPAGDIPQQPAAATEEIKEQLPALAPSTEQADLKKIDNAEKAVSDAPVATADLATPAASPVPAAVSADIDSASPTVLLGSSTGAPALLANKEKESEDSSSSEEKNDSAETKSSDESGENKSN